MLVCDGGSLGNPGKGYGSFQLTDREGFRELRRLDLGDWMTNNQAEYLTLITGLEAALRQAETRGCRPEDVCISVRTDSQLVVEQLLGRWKVRHPNLRPLHAKAASLLARFGRRDVAWQPRSETLSILGH